MKLFKNFLLSIFVFVSLFLITSFTLAAEINVNVTADPASIQYNGTSSIHWSAPGADSCTSSTGQGGTGATGTFSISSLTSSTHYLVNCFSGAGCVSTSPPLYPQCGSKSTQTACESYKAGNIPESVCEWQGSSGSGSALVTVASPVFSVNVSASKNPINSGESTTIGWTSILADSCTSSTGQGGIGTSGNFSVSPTSTTSYSVTCTRQVSVGACLSDWGNIEVYSTVDPQTAADLGTASYHCSRPVYNTESSCNSMASWASPGGADAVQQVCYWSPGNSNATSVNSNVTVTVNNLTPTTNLFFNGDPNQDNATVISGSDVVLNWFNTNITSGLCNVLKDGVVLAGNQPINYHYPIGIVNNPPITAPITYTVSCWKTVNPNIPYTDNGILTVTTPSQTSFPDLTATAVTPTTVVSGTPFTLRATINNQGNASTIDGFYNFFQWTDTNPSQYSLKNSKDFNLAFLFQKAFATGGITDVTPAIHLDTLDVNATGIIEKNNFGFPGPGVYYARACADKSDSGDEGVIDEGNNEDNNCGPWTTITVGSATPMPNLTADVPSIPATNINAGIATLTSTIRNQGSVSTGADFYNFFQVSDVDPYSNSGNNMSKLYKNSIFSFIFPKAFAVGDTLHDLSPGVKMSALSKNGSGSTTASYTFSDGIYWIRACSDKTSRAGGGLISESNEGDNCSSWKQITVGSAVDGVCYNLATPGTYNHYRCLKGPSINNNPNDPTNWIWDCQGSQNTTPPGSTAHCTEAKPVMRGTLTPLHTSCVIPLGQSKCTIKFNWTVVNPEVATTYIVIPPLTPPYSSSQIKNTSTSLIGNAILDVNYNSETFYLVNHLKLLDGKTVTSACAAGSSWNGSICQGNNLPDLTAGMTSPAVVPIKTPFTFSATITNLNNVPTSTVFHNLFQIADDIQGTNFQDISSLNTQATLGANASVTVLSSPYTFSKMETKYVRACANKIDSGHFDISESDITNNCGPWTSVTGTDNTIDGKCNVTHYNCISGNPDPTSYAGGTGVDDPWTWTCEGVNGGKTDKSCKEEYTGKCQNSLYTNYPDCNKCVNNLTWPVCTPDNDVCPIGTYNYPECTCDNNATNPPACTLSVDGNCNNGTNNPPNCTKKIPKYIER